MTRRRHAARLQKALPFLLSFGTLCYAYNPSPELPPHALNPQVQSIVSQVSAERIADIQRKLESFGTRNIYSATDDPSHGVGAAREWIAQQFKSYSPKLQVTFDKHRLAGSPTKRYFRNVEIWNVVAVLTGTSEPERHVMVSGHYDSISSEKPSSLWLSRRKSMDCLEAGSTQRMQ